MKLTGARIGKIGLAVVVGIWVFGASGCDVQDEIRSNAPSPDGRWVATARTIETGGFDIVTDVSLKWTKRSSTTQQILGFINDGSTSRTNNLSMDWVAPTHLDVTYDGLATVDFQVVKCGDVDITLRELSKTTNSTRPEFPDFGFRVAPSRNKSPSR